MSFSASSNIVEGPVIQTVFSKELDSSSEEPPQEEWSSLVFEIPEGNLKRIMYADNLYDPGSGEICTKYIAQSDSAVLRHPYYNYPGIKDPGIREALLHPIPKVIYADDGQELYLALCNEMGLCPVRIFYRQLLEDTISLMYYGINPAGFRPMAMSLKLNRNVRVLDLTDNWIGDDGCFHLGEMLVDNITLSEMNLTGCRIGPEGARRLFNNMHVNRSLKTLNLSKNQLGDKGLVYFSTAIFKGADVTNVNFSYNGISGQSIMSLAEALETTNKFTHLDLSWNSILSPNAVVTLCTRLSENPKFEELNMSWNALSGQRVGVAMKLLLKNPNIRKLILRNNKLEGPAITAIGVNLNKSKRLETLDLSYNPLTPADAMSLLLRLQNRLVKLQNLIMENVLVSYEFLEARQEILNLKFRQNTVISYGGISAKYIPVGPDPREIVMNRIEAICKSSKKNPIDFALLALAMYKIDKNPIEQQEFGRAVKKAGAALDNDLLLEMLNVFPGPKTAKSRTINMEAMIDFIKRKWPDRKLPPTPPPEVEVPPVASKGKKGKKK